MLKSPRSFSSASKKLELERSGYTVLEGCLPESPLKDLKQNLIETIKTCADDLDIEFKKYLGAVSRWVDPSPVTKDLLSLLEDPLTDLLSAFFEEDVTPIKWNLICKNKHNNRPVPLHQDICYSPHQPYQVSAWLALDDVDEQSGPLVVRKRSHKEALQPAVDFWSPTHRPCKLSSVKVPVQKGDIILFDSRLWHGSAVAIKEVDRYACVSRWSCQSYEPPKAIPPLQKAPFGMWTCQEETQKILTQGSKLLYQQEPDDFIALLDLWITKLKKKKAPFKLSFKKAIISLTNVKILHLANAHHNGGDASGALYKDLWHHLLQALQVYIRSKKWTF